jgi:hypothetical protein
MKSTYNLYLKLAINLIEKYGESAETLTKIETVVPKVWAPYLIADALGQTSNV